jgi:hypothetical protein
MFYEGFHFATQVLVTGTCLAEEGFPILRELAQGPLKDSVDLLPAFRIRAL